jgi:hypothetical protein
MIVGFSAMIGGAAMILDPTGSKLMLKLDLLRNTFFDNYLVPGVVLFFVIGVLSVSAAVLTMGNYKNHPSLIFYQGVLLTGWIITQVYLLTETHYLQFVLGITGLVLMMLGGFLMISKNRGEVLY